MRCCIFGAGNYNGEGILFTENAFLIAADGGLAHLSAIGLQAQLAVGDFDSLGQIPSGVEVAVYPAVKDDTDMALAANIAIERGYDELFLFGGMGGRLDHTFANIALLHRLAKSGIPAYLVGREGILTVLMGGETAVFSSACRGYLSVFALTEKAEGVTLSNLEYPLDRGTLFQEEPLGVSNRFLGREASVSLETGALLLYWDELDNSLPARKKGSCKR